MNNKNTVPFLLLSRDRACQLELILRSIQTNWLGSDQISFTVLYRTSSDDDLQGYNKLMKDTKKGPFKIIWQPQYNFGEQFAQWLHTHKDDFVGLFTDDCIFYKPFRTTPSDVVQLISPDCLCFSLRLGLNTTKQYYVENTYQRPLSDLGYELLDGDYIKWNWKIRPPYENYGYAFSWDGYIYRASDLIYWCGDGSFGSPRHLECHLSDFFHPRQKLSRDYMLADKEGHVFSNSINVVHDPKDATGLAGLFHPASAEELNQRYLQGEIIDFKKMDFSGICGSHDEIPLKWKKNN